MRYALNKDGEKEMFESIIDYIENKKDGFSLTIFYDILFPYIDITFENTIRDIYKKQAVSSIDDISIQSLNWREILAFFTAIYHQDNNLKYPRQKFEDGTFEKLAQRLKSLDKQPQESNFDDRKYYVLKNVILNACHESQLKNDSILFHKNGTITFPVSRHIDNIEIDLTNLGTPKELRFTYFEALEKNGWIMMYETHNEFEIISGGEKYKEYWNQQ